MPDRTESKTVGKQPIHGENIPSRKGNQSKLPPSKTWLWFLAILLFNYFLMSGLFPGNEPTKIPYTLFKSEIAKSNVEAIYTKGETINGQFRDTVTYTPLNPQQPTAKISPQKVVNFTTTVPSFVDPGLETLLIEHGVVIRAEPIVEQTGPLLTFLMRFGPALLLIGLYVWFYRRAKKQGGIGGGFMGMGSSKARRFDKAQVEKIIFDDVAGIDEAENELVEIVAGVGAARVRDLFKQAREHAPSIVFIDEKEILEVTGLPPAPPIKQVKKMKFFRQ